MNKLQECHQEWNKLQDKVGEVFLLQDYKLKIYLNTSHMLNIPCRDLKHLIDELFVGIQQITHPQSQLWREHKMNMEFVTDKFHLVSQCSYQIIRTTINHLYYCIKVNYYLRQGKRFLQSICIGIQRRECYNQIKYYILSLVIHLNLVKLYEDIAHNKFSNVHQYSLIVQSPIGDCTI